MTRVSVELVPRSPEALLTDVQTVRDVLPQVRTLNVPDLMRFDLRSYDAASLVTKQAPFEVIPQSAPSISRRAHRCRARTVRN